MLRIGLTGGMGCGKSTIAHIFSVLGIEIYDADSRAKYLSDLPEVKAEIARIWGSEAAADRKKLAAIVFEKPEELAKLNALLHPLVFEDSRKWFEQIEKDDVRPYAIVEAAILFESRMENEFDYIIDVEAPEEDRIARILARDRCSREEILARLARQLSPEERMKKSHFILHNGDRDRVLPAVLELDRRFRK